MAIVDDNMCIIGDFNVVVDSHERSSTMTSQRLPMEEFRTFIAMMDLYDIDYTGISTHGLPDVLRVLF